MKTYSIFIAASYSISVVGLVLLWRHALSSHKANLVRLGCKGTQSSDSAA